MEVSDDVLDEYMFRFPAFFNQCLLVLQAPLYKNKPD